MNNALQTQRSKLAKFKATSPQERIQKLQQLKNALNQHRAELRKALYQDFKKPPIESDLTEIMPTVSSLNYIISNLHRWMKPVKVKTGFNALVLGSKSTILYEARGQVLIISPWNYPLYLSLVPVAEAIAAGNAVVLKPSEFTPHTNAVISNILNLVFQGEEILVFEGDAQVATELLKFPFHHLFFTGSTAVGKIVMEAAAKNLASVTLELGGKSPCIIDADVDMADAVKKIIWGKFVNAGQTCIAPDFILVAHSRHQEFIELCCKSINDIYSDKKNLAHIINATHFKRLKSLVDEAIGAGAKLVCGNVTQADDNYFSPTILLNPPRNTKIMQQEIFGPVMPVLTFTQPSEVITLVNQMSRPLALYIFSCNKTQQAYYTNNIISGGVAINEVILQVSNHHLPFGGVNESGLGNYHGIFGFKTFSHERAVLNRKLNLGVTHFYPPYGKSKQSLVDFVFKKLNRFL